jgi:carboxymethylenebutenolidase
MADEHNPQQESDDITRRDFVRMSIAAGIAVAPARPRRRAGLGVETNVDVKTPDGTCDAVFVHPAHRHLSGRADLARCVRTTAVDARIRETYRRRRLCGPGAEPVLSHGQGAGVRRPVEVRFRQHRRPRQAGDLHRTAERAGAAERDAIAYIAFLDAQKQVDRNKKVGTQGYCMGGPLIMKTAAAVPNRVGAAASFHGGGLVTPNPTSPHLLIPKMKARLYIGIAANDDMTQPTAKDTLKQAFADAKVPAEIEVYPTAQHGWCVPDMPLQANGMPIYNKEAAERAWGKLVALYKTALV